jgi:hypothetical protein
MKSYFDILIGRLHKIELAEVKLANFEHQVHTDSVLREGLRKAGIVPEITPEMSAKIKNKLRRMSLIKLEIAKRIYEDVSH